MAIYKEVECPQSGEIRNHWVLLRVSFERRRVVEVSHEDPAGPQPSDESEVAGRAPFIPVNRSVNFMAADIETAVWGCWTTARSFNNAKQKSLDSGSPLEPPPAQSQVFVLRTERLIDAENPPISSVEEAYKVHKPLSDVLADGVDV